MIHRNKNTTDTQCENECENIFKGTEQKWYLTDSWSDLYDHSVLLDKLDPTLRIYCEGEPKPTWRGALHYINVTLFLIAFPFLYKVCNSTEEKIAVCIFTASNFFCFFFSVLLHRFTWNPVQEIFVQKLDHSGVFLNIAGNCTSYIILGLKKTFWFLLAPVWIAAIYGIVLVFLKKKRNKHSIYTSVGLIITAFFIHYFFQTTQILLFWGVWIPMIISLISFVTQAPTLWPETFGYHEFFHLCTVIAAISGIALEFSLLQGGLHPPYPLAPRIAIQRASEASPSWNGAILHFCKRV